VTEPDASSSDRRSLTRQLTKRTVGLSAIVRNALLVIGPGQRPTVVILCVTAVVAATFESALLFFLARVATSFSNGSDEVPMSFGPFIEGSVPLSTVLAISAVLLVCLLLLSVPLAQLSASLSEHALVRVRTRIVEAYLASAPFHRSQESEGHLQTLIGEHAQRAERVVQQMSTIVVSATGTLVLALAAVLIAPVPALCGALAFAVVVWALRPLSGSVKRGATAFSDANSGLLSSVAQTARVGQEIAAFEVEAEVKAALDDQIRTGAQSLRRMRLTGRLTPMLYQYVALGLVIAAIAVLSGIGTDEVDYIGPLVLLLVRALGYAKQLNSAVQVGNELAPYVDGVEEEVAALAVNRREPGTLRLERVERLTFEHVSFAYRPGEPVLRGVDVVLEHGETVGIIGASGAGKTTLVELMLRLLVPDEGSILVDGTELSAVAPEAWSQLVAFVPQENKLVRATVADNIRFYRTGYLAGDVEDAARRAHLHDEILELPDGYDTMVGPGERSMSGGQRQRLGIARALLGRPSILVLDEPTSALDPRSEELVKRTLVELRGNTTLALVAHRESTLEICSRFLVVEGGRVRSVVGRATGDVA
jgi:ABC-type multidrug transport system fused ATPase/permease subunit